jgi:uncharacterized membrane protein
MNGTVALYLVVLALAGAVMLLLPDISPRRYFFAITVPEGFRASDAGRASLRRYYAWVWASLAVAAAAIVAFADSYPVALAFVPMLPMIVGLAAFLRERAVVRRLVPPQPQVREADLAGDDHLPHWVLLALPAFVLPIAAARWLRAHWEQIPERFPVHWNAIGQSDRWADKTPHAVYGPLLYGCGMMLFLLFMAVAMYYGSRRSVVRVAILKVMVAAIWLMGIIFTGIGLAPVVGFPPLWFFAPVPVFVTWVLIWSVRLARLPAEATPDDAWILGSIYYNPHDAAIFVQKRIGFGFTFNFGNRMTWIIVASMVMIFIGLVWLLPR